MTQEFHISVTPIGGNEYLVRTERIVPGSLVAEEQVTWAVEDWLAQASRLMNDPLMGLLRGENLGSIPAFDGPPFAQPSTSLVHLGQQLYNALFQGSVRDSWVTARGISQHLRQMLRLRLGLKDPRLSRLPWEVMYAGDRPLATGTDVLFSRYHSSSAAFASCQSFQPLPLAQPRQPIRILMVLAAPNDQERLALKQEAQSLQEELQTGMVGNGIVVPIELTILDQPGREQLTQALEHNSYQIFHYAGHSNLGSSGGNLYLVNHRTGLSETLSGEDLAGLLANNDTRMAVFNSCRGGHTAAGGDNEGNLAEALVCRGIPSVLAMAERIPDNVALNLSRLFYRNLKQGYPIDLSLNRARQGLLSSYGSHQLYWALPILYLHPQSDGYLQPAVSTGHYPELSLDTVLPEEINALPPAASQPDVPPASQPVAPAAAVPITANADQDWVFSPSATDDWETVARMVNQLSATHSEQEEAMLPADLTENLLPDAGLSPLPSDSGSLALPAERHARLGDPSVLVATTMVMDKGDPDLYRELEQILSDSGKSTAAIAAGLQAIQQHPEEAGAYHQLGNALADQGYLPEAIATYQRALRLAPNAPDLYHHLGTAFYQQGQLPEAIQALNRAIQLDPSLSQAYQKLGEAIRRQNQPTSIRPYLAATPNPDQYLPRDRSAFTVRRQPLWLWLGLGVGSIALVLLGGWFAQRQFANHPMRPTQEQTQPTPGSGALGQKGTAEVTAIAINAFSQGDLRTGQMATEALLERRAFKSADEALGTVQPAQREEPTVLFLKGRLAWQASVQNHDRDFSPTDAIRFWGEVTQKNPSAMAQNALGFAYYSAGQHDQAREAWLRTIAQLGLQPDPATQAVPKEALTAYAGIALVLVKKAEALPPENRTGLYTEAKKLRQKILTAAPTEYTPNALSKDWLWSERAIADWRRLLALR